MVGLVSDPGSNPLGCENSPIIQNKPEPRQKANRGLFNLFLSGHQGFHLCKYKFPINRILPESTNIQKFFIIEDVRSKNSYPTALKSFVEKPE